MTNMLQAAKAAKSEIARLSTEQKNNALLAMADALIESLCDQAEASITKGFDTVPRFSPGYADLPLHVGVEIVRLLSAETHLGIRFTESGLMVPKKSVSAIVCVKD